MAGVAASAPVSLVSPDPVSAEVPALVLDTNIVLDVWLFADAAAAPLIVGLSEGRWRWLVTVPMREELARVLTYPQIVKSLSHHQLCAAEVLAHLDAHAQWVAVAARAAVICKDPDDQKFIDLAVAHRATLLSKDRAVLSMAKRLVAHGVIAKSAIH